MCDNFFYMKDIGFANSNTRQSLTKYSELFKDLALIYKENYKIALNIDNKFEV
jgi:hypothetical protein